MVNYQGRGKRRYTGAKNHPSEKKQKRWFGRDPVETKIGETRKKIIRTRGGNFKIKLYTDKMINVVDPKTNITQHVLIKKLDENKASVDLKRRSILTKGAIVDTDIGKARITSRPGQTGIINGILME